MLPHPPPEDDWRSVLSEIADGLWVTGEPLTGNDAPLAEWERHGAATVLDVTDHGAPLVRPSSVRRMWVPTPDDASPREASWMAAVLAVEGPVVVHCHMGVARAPSVAFGLLLRRGLSARDALELVMRQRPIAAVDYAPDFTAFHFGVDIDDPRVVEVEQLRARLLTETRLALLAAAAPPA